MNTLEVQTVLLIGVLIVVFAALSKFYCTSNKNRIMGKRTGYNTVAWCCGTLAAANARLSCRTNHQSRLCSFPASPDFIFYCCFVVFFILICENHIYRALATQQDDRPSTADTIWGGLGLEVGRGRGSSLYQRHCSSSTTDVLTSQYAAFC